MAQPDSAFDHNVFINCPFDAGYLPLLRALLFAVIECGFEPRIASEQADSGAVRVDKIKELIQASRYSIHDISRMEPLRDGDLPRFNMPFELGLDLGCRDFGSGRLATKHCLILERDLYRYQRVLSDIAGNDIQAHGADPQRLVRHVRNWLYSQTDERLASGTMIWRRFNGLSTAFSKNGHKDYLFIYSSLGWKPEMVGSDLQATPRRQTFDKAHIPWSRGFVSP